jgi:hypothetical protein
VVEFVGNLLNVPLDLELTSLLQGEVEEFVLREADLVVVERECPDRGAVAHASDDLPVAVGACQVE